MTFEEEEYSKAYGLWRDFKEEVLYKNRFFVNHEIFHYIKKVAETYSWTLEKGKVLYRARLYTGDVSFLYYLKNDKASEMFTYIPAIYHPIKSRELSGFWGYNKDDSFVPPNNVVKDGRTNPAYITYLYTAEAPYTALVEVRPYLNSKVSIAEILLDEELTVANFSYETFGKLEGFESYLMYLIMEDFSHPTDFDTKNYIPSQCIAEFIKNLGLDGIRFNSSLDKAGRNITIFNFEKCHPISSKLYEIEDICFQAKGIAPLNEESLVHRKLEIYEREIKKKALASLLANKTDSHK